MIPLTSPLALVHLEPGIIIVAYKRESRPLNKSVLSSNSIILPDASTTQPSELVFNTPDVPSAILKASARFRVGLKREPYPSGKRYPQGACHKSQLCVLLGYWYFFTKITSGQSPFTQNNSW